MARDWQQTVPAGRESSTRREIDDRIATTARRQRHLIRLALLIDPGLSERAAQKRVNARRLHRVRRGVYALHPPPYSRHQLRLAAVYACGPGTALSDLCAANHLGLWEQAPPLIDVTNASGRGRSLRGIAVHRRKLIRRDVLFVAGIPCTSPARTVIDCAASLSEDGLEDLLLAADAKRSLNRERLDELLAARRGQPGIGRLRRLITDDPVESRSINERRLFKICRRHGIPLPLVNHPIETGGRTFIADFCWPGLGLIVEADSWRWHGGHHDRERDADRDQLLSIAGWRVVRFTRDQIKHRPDEVGRRLSGLTRDPLEALSASAAAAAAPSSRRPRRPRRSA
jgi:predicted transcriptional regulator of viral defense system